MLKRLLDLFEGPAGLEPWSPPETLAALSGVSCPGARSMSGASST